MIRNYLDLGNSSMHHYYMLCGIWRHDGLMCAAGKYRVITDDNLFDAVMDDFGNLVRV